ncbi:unnamed protein product [Amoebophrya sp. A25]|nr:unnamed protein product [Amoebophrya sp. A25]|eukprot:GSA25T00004999001.1
MQQHHSMQQQHPRFERRRDARLSADELKDVTVEQFVEIAKDKWKSRSLQRALMENDAPVSKLVYAKAEPVFVQLLSDQYGNYLSQKILEYCTDEQFDLLFSKVEGKLWELANEVHGTRAVQKFVEESVKRNRAENVLSALREHIEALSRSVTGFHVVVKLLEKMSRDDVEKILGNLCKDAATVVAMGKDQWGCCVLKACIDTAEGERQQVIVDAIVSHTLELVQDPYGNYVVQHVLASSNCFMQQQVLPPMIKALKDHVLDLCQQKFSSNVLEKLLTTAPDVHKQVLIQGVLAAGKLETTEVAKHLLFHQYGNYVLQQTLAVAKDPQHTTLLEAVRPLVQKVLKHFLENPHDAASSLAIPNHGSTSLAPEQAQRLGMKLVKRFPCLLEGMSESEKQQLSNTSHYTSNADEAGGNGGMFGSGSSYSPHDGSNTWGSQTGSPYDMSGPTNYFNSMYPNAYSAAMQASWAAQYNHLLALGQAAAGQAAGKFGHKGNGKGFKGGKGGYGSNSFGGKQGGSSFKGNQGGKGAAGSNFGGSNTSSNGHAGAFGAGGAGAGGNGMNGLQNMANMAAAAGMSLGNMSNHGMMSNNMMQMGNQGAAMGGGAMAGMGDKQNAHSNYYTAYAHKAAQALASLNALQQASMPNVQSSPMSSAGMPATPGDQQMQLGKQSAWAYPTSDYGSSSSYASSPDSGFAQQNDEMARIVGFWPNYQITYDEQ